jgi:hypothetical protein
MAHLSAAPQTGRLKNFHFPPQKITMKRKLRRKERGMKSQSIIYKIVRPTPVGRIKITQSQQVKQ